jgi:hypothetical protein
VDERRYIEHFERYVTHVSYWVKHEKVPNPLTGVDEDPDQDLMADVERLLGVRSSGMSPADFRGEVITKLALPTALAALTTAPRLRPSVWCWVLPNAGWTPSCSTLPRSSDPSISSLRRWARYS